MTDVVGASRSENQGIIRLVRRGLNSSPLPKLSRRDFLVPGLVLAAGASSFGAEKVRVQVTTGGHTAPLPLYTIFNDDLFSDAAVAFMSHPQAFDRLNGGAGPEVLVLYDWTDWEEKDRPHVQRYLDGGRGLVVLHHALASNQEWPWWYREVTGGLQVLYDHDGLKASGLKQMPPMNLTPVGHHPITASIGKFHLDHDEVFVKMWQSPKITPLLESDEPDSSKVVAWIGVHPKARVVCIQFGHHPVVLANANYRKLVHNAVLWSARRLS